jgi:uncharacterized membrane protein
MSHDLQNLAARAAPAIFVVLWSTGFVGTKYVLNNAEPFTYLAIRMAFVVVLMAIIAAVTRPKWPDRTGIGHSIVAGLLVHGFYLGGTAVAIAHSIPAGLSALIPGLQPILTSTLANRWLGERVTPLQWTGLLVGLAGVVLILHDRPMSGEAGWGWLASGVSLVSITLGTLYQRRYCNTIDWRAGNLVQYIAVAIFFGLCREAVRDQCGALDHRVRARARLADGGAVDRIDRAVVLADPPLGRDLGGKPVLSGAGSDLADGLFPVRRAARCDRHRRHGGLRRGSIPGQPAQDMNPISRTRYTLTPDPRTLDPRTLDPRTLDPRTLDPRCAIAHRGISIRSVDRHLGGHLGCGTIRIYGFGDFQPCG